MSWFRRDSPDLNASQMQHQYERYLEQRERNIERCKRDLVVYGTSITRESPERGVRPLKLEDMYLMGALVAPPNEKIDPNQAFLRLKREQRK